MSRVHRAVLSGVLLVALTVAGCPVMAVASDPPSGDQVTAEVRGRVSGHAAGGSVTVSNTSGGDAKGSSTPATAAKGPEYQFHRIAQSFCGTLDAVTTSAPCVEGAPSGRVIRYCADGSEALDPLFRREVDGVTGQFVGLWEQMDTGGCPEDVPANTVVLSAEEFRRLPLTASVPQFQPAGGRGLVNMDLIVFTDPAPQTLATTLLGVPVTVLATPVEYTWDFGDGSAPLVTTDPGAPYPDYTVGHPYRQPGTYAVQLTTTWSGQFQVNGVGPWLPVDGTATTTSPTFTSEVVEARAHLVAGSDRP